MAAAAPLGHHPLVPRDGALMAATQTIGRLPALAPLGLPRLLGRRDRGAVPVHTGRALIDEVERSGLRGRGGGGFPTSLKMAAVADRPGRAVVVANGTEGEPASHKDAVLLAHDPDLVIDGALAAADAVGAREVIIAISRASGTALARTDDAARRRAAGARPIRLSVVATPERFVAGEESALVHWLNGGPAKPTLTPPRPSERGVDGRPTLLQNVETMAHIGLIARHGADWFCRLGTDAEPGSMLVTIGGAVRSPGVHEIELGTPIRHVLALGGGPTDDVAGVLVGGYFGTWLRTDDPMDVPFSRAGLRPIGGSVGAGTIVVLPRAACGLVETARVARYLARESAGQCGPCVFGLRALADASVALAGGLGAVEALREMQELPAEIERRGACAHPDGAARLVRSALAAFPDEVQLHLQGRCSAADRSPVLPVPAPFGEWR
jgi:NADH:ubiquinone oxidoreductase subunit F (NADH-binding)